MDDNGFKDESISKVENNRKPGKPKGLPKSGGRVSGTPNKSNAKWSEVLESKEFSIPEQAIKLFFDENTQPSLKLQILTFLASYTASTIKPKEEVVESEESQPPSDIINLVKNE